MSEHIENLINSREFLEPKINGVVIGDIGDLNCLARSKGEGGCKKEKRKE